MAATVEKIDVHQINWYVPFDALRKSVDLIEKSPANGAGVHDGIRGYVGEALDSLQDVHLEAGSEAAQVIPAVISRLRIVTENPEKFVSGPGLGELKAFARQLRDALPDFRIVLLDDEKRFDRSIVGNVGEIETVYSAYLYDARRPVHLAEITPSYELHYIDTYTEGDVDDAIRDAIKAAVAPEESSIYMHTRVIDAMHWNMRSVCPEPNELSKESYDELAGEMVEYLRCNVLMDGPRPLVNATVLRYAGLLEAIGSEAAAEELVSNLDPILTRLVRSNPDLAGGIQDAVRALPALNSEVGDVAVRAEYAAQFLDEVLANYGSLGALSDKHGPSALIDAMYLQNAILKSEPATFGANSQIQQIVEGLSSAGRWQSHFSVMDRYAEPVSSSGGRGAAPAI